MNTDSLEAIPKSRAFRVQVCESLSRSPMFRDFSWDEIDTLSTYMVGYRAVPGTLLFTEGEVGEAMGLLLSGEIEVRKQDELGQARTVATIVGGRTFGEMSVIDGEKRSASCLATQPCVLALLPKPQFDRLLADNEQLAIKFLLKLTRSLSQRLRSMSDAFVDYLGREN